MAASSVTLMVLKLPVGCCDRLARKFCQDRPIVCDPRLPAFLGPRFAATIPRNSLVLLRLLIGLIVSLPEVLVCAFFLAPNAWPVSLLALPMPRGILRLPALATSFV